MQKLHASALRCEWGNVQDKRGNILLIFSWLRPRAPDLTHHLHNAQTLHRHLQRRRQMGEGGIRVFLTLSVSFKCESIFTVKELCGACVCHYHRSPPWSLPWMEPLCGPWTAPAHAQDRRVCNWLIRELCEIKVVAFISLWFPAYRWHHLTHFSLSALKLRLDWSSPPDMLFSRQTGEFMARFRVGNSLLRRTEPSFHCPPSSGQEGSWELINGEIL